MQPAPSTHNRAPMSRPQPRPAVSCASACSAARIPPALVTATCRVKSLASRNRRKRFFTSQEMQKLVAASPGVRADGAAGGPASPKQRSAPIAANGRDRRRKVTWRIGNLVGCRAQNDPLVMGWVHGNAPQDRAGSIGEREGGDETRTGEGA